MQRAAGKASMQRQQVREVTCYFKYAKEAQCGQNAKSEKNGIKLDCRIIRNFKVSNLDCHLSPVVSFQRALRSK